MSDSIKSLWWYISHISCDMFLTQIIRDETERHRPSVQGQGSEVKEVKEHFNRVESLWQRIIAGMNKLMERSKPWVEFTKKFDSFCVSIERLERKVREAEAVDNMAEEEGGDLSEKIVLFKVNYFAAFRRDGTDYQRMC